VSQNRPHRHAQLAELLARYGLPPEVVDLYPHELSGGMARRVLLCCALMDGPKVIIADEPTPGLDLELAQRALEDFRAFADEGGGVLLITHDIELALRVADRVAVFNDGTVVEETSVDAFASPDTLQHPFSKALWHALPEHSFTDDTKGTVLFVPHAAQKEPSLLCPRPTLALQARDLHFSYPGQPPLLAGIDLTIESWERVALSAPSGAGKSTLCKLLAGYLTPQSGAVLVENEPLPRRGVCPVQLIWQHPEQALDSHLRMKDALAEAINGAKFPPSLVALMQQLEIRDEWLNRYPHELSGGELQRFCIARALAVHPRFIIADEISTMLDAVTQARIWQVLLDACRTYGIGLVFVSHSPALMTRIATRTIQAPAPGRRSHRGVVRDTPMRQ
jgi:ABC-type dipeptide/oligopeptide/nickel transport system ATPase subunit